MISQTQLTQLRSDTYDPTTNPNYLISPKFANINNFIFDELTNNITYKSNPYYSSGVSGTIFSTLNPDKIINLPKEATMIENLVVKNIFVENILANAIESSFFRNKLYEYTNVENTNQTFSRFVLSRYLSGLNYNLNLYKHNYNNLKLGYQIGQFQQNGFDINGNPNYIEAVNDKNYIDSTPVLNIMNYQNMLEFQLNENMLQNSIQSRISYLWDYRLFSSQYFNNLVEEDIDQTTLFDTEYSINLKPRQKPFILFSDIDKFEKNFWNKLKLLNLVGPIYDNQGKLKNIVNPRGILTGYDANNVRIYPEDLYQVTSRYDDQGNLVDLDDEFWQSQTTINTGSFKSTAQGNPPRAICLDQQNEIAIINNVNIIQSYEDKQFKYNMFVNQLSLNKYEILVESTNKYQLTTSNFTSNFINQTLSVITSNLTGNSISWCVNPWQHGNINCLERLKCFVKLFNLCCQLKMNWNDKQTFKNFMTEENKLFVHEAYISTSNDFSTFYDNSLIKTIIDNSFYYNLPFDTMITDSFTLRQIKFPVAEPRFEISSSLRDARPRISCMMLNNKLTGEVMFSNYNKSLTYDSISIVF